MAPEGSSLRTVFYLIRRGLPESSGEFGLLNQIGWALGEVPAMLLLTSGQIGGIILTGYGIRQAFDRPHASDSKGTSVQIGSGPRGAFGLSLTLAI